MFRLLWVSYVHMGVRRGDEEGSQGSTSPPGVTKTTARFASSFSQNEEVWRTRAGAPLAGLPELLKPLGSAGSRQTRGDPAALPLRPPASHAEPPRPGRAPVPRPSAPAVPGGPLPPSRPPQGAPHLA